MIRNIPVLMVISLAFVARGFFVSAAEPRFAEVYDALRTNLTGISEEQLNQSAVKALLTGVKPRASLLSLDLKEASGSESGLAKVSAFDNEIAYLRVARVAGGIDTAVRNALTSLAATNKLKGIVLDLRYAKGQDYSAAASLAQLFIRREQPLSDWGEGFVKAKANPDAISMPVAALVNGETARAAELLAAVLREAGAALILGSRTAGEAMMFREVPLNNGDRLRVGVGPVLLAGGASVPTNGVKPDIMVQVSAEDERAYFADSFKLIARTNVASSVEFTGAGTNRTRRLRYNEAELVRERREGLNPEDQPTSARDFPADKPVVHDPVLARGIDVLKGLAVVRQGRS